MIYIFEELSKTELKTLQKLNPLMDYRYTHGTHHFQTFWAGWEIKDGMIQEIRKIKFFNIDQTKSGFICSNVKEAKDLCLFIQGNTDNSIVQKYPFIKEYIKNKDVRPYESIAIPVRSFILYSVQYKSALLDNFDIKLLEKNGIDISDYIPIKHFEGGTIESPSDRKKRSQRGKT